MFIMKRAIIIFSLGKKIYVLAIECFGNTEKIYYLYERWCYFSSTSDIEHLSLSVSLYIYIATVFILYIRNGVSLYTYLLTVHKIVAHASDIALFCFRIILNFY